MSAVDRNQCFSVKHILFVLCLELRGFESLGEQKIIIVIVVEMQTYDLSLDPRPTYGLTKVTGKFEQACLGMRRCLADLDLNLV